MDQNEAVLKVKVIKRYANRKLYDTENSSYVTLRDIQGFVVAGRDVLVVDNSSKRDITAKTLFASLIETESNKDDLDLVQVVNLIKTGIFSK